MKLSTDTFNIPTSLNAPELANCLAQETVASSRLVMKTTSKAFIGTVSGHEFRLINAWFPVGAACVLTGHLNKENSQIVLTTSLHKAFRVLFTIWLLVMMALVILGLAVIKTSEAAYWVMSIFGLAFLATMFRLFLHGVYVLARNKATKKLNELIGANG